MLPILCKVLVRRLLYKSAEITKQVAPLASEFRYQPDAAVLELLAMWQRLVDCRLGLGYQYQ